MTSLRIYLFARRELIFKKSMESTTISKLLINLKYKLRFNDQLNQG